MDNSLQLWEEPKRLEEVKRIFAPSLNQLEFSVFVGIGKATGLNPFLREIWAVKYGNNASIFIGRDGYRKSAQRSSDYDYHISDAVYSNDQFEVTDGVPKHLYSFKNDRGKLIGAYCVVKRKKSSKPNFTFVELKEYSTGKTLWATKPATMIKKVAEAQALRMTFQELFAGTYDESEEWEVKTTQKAKVEVVNAKKITEAQANQICDLFIKVIKNEDPEIQRKTVIHHLTKMYKVDAVSKLTFEQANDLIPKLQARLAEKNKPAKPETARKEVKEPDVAAVQQAFPGSTVVDDTQQKKAKE